MKDFTRPGGTYHSWLLKIKYHIQLVKCMGKECQEMRNQEISCSPFGGILKCQRDYTDKWKMSQHGQTQNEGFAQDQALGIEGFYFDAADCYGQRSNYYYGVLSDEKEQNASTTYANTRLILEHMFNNQGAMKRHELTRIYEVTDGCTAQYRCSTA